MTEWLATTQDQFEDKASVRIQTLAEVGALEQVLEWTAAGGGLTITWTATITQYPQYHSVKVIDRAYYTDPDPTLDEYERVELTSRASSALVDANPGSFYWAQATDTVYVSAPDSSDPNGKLIYVGFDLHFSKGPHLDTTSEVVLDGRPYSGRIISTPNWDKQVNNPFWGVVSSGAGSLMLTASDGAWDDAFARYVWEGQVVRFYFGGDSLPKSEYLGPFTFRTFDRLWSDEVLTLNMRDEADRLDTQIQAELFSADDATLESTFFIRGFSPRYVASRGGGQSPSNIHYDILVQSPADLDATAATSTVPIDDPKPIIYGRVTAHPVVKLGASQVRGIYQISGHPNARVRSLTISGGSGTTQTQFDDNTASGAGALSVQYSINADRNLILISTDTSGSGNFDQRTSLTITVDVDGMADPNTGEMIENPAAIVEDLISRRSELSDVAINAEALERATFAGSLFKFGFVIEDAETSLRDILSEIMQNSLAYLFANNDGEIVYYIWYPTLEGETDFDELYGDFKGLKVSTRGDQLYGGVSVEYARDPNRVGAEYLRYRAVEAEQVAAHNSKRFFPLEQSLHTDIGSAITFAIRLARFSSRPPMSADFESGWRKMSADMMAKARLTRSRLPKRSDVDQMRGTIVSQVRNPNDGSIRNNLDDARVTGSQAFITTTATTYAAATPAQRLDMGFLTDDDGLSDPADPASARRSRYG